MTPPTGHKHREHQHPKHRDEAATSVESTESSAAERQQQHASTSAPELDHFPRPHYPHGHVPVARDSSHLRHLKQASRKSIKAALQALTTEAMQKDSHAICDTVLASSFFAASQRVGVYLHCDRLREVDTGAVVAAALAAGKRCFVPVVDDKHSNMRLLHLDDMSALVAMPPFGIMEPQRTYAKCGTPREDVMDSSGSLDLLIMPGLGFDKSGQRLGRGGGYYDKLIERLKHKSQEVGAKPPLLVALAYEPQMVQEVPVGEHDEPVDVIITASHVIACTPRGHEELGQQAAL